MNYLDSLGINEDQYVQADSIADNMAAVESDNADVMVATDATANVAAQNNSSGNVEFVEEFEQPIIEGESVMAYGAAVFPQSDEGDEMREAYNEGLQELIDSGELLEILEEFGFTEANLPPTDITTEDRCNV